MVHVVFLHPDLGIGGAERLVIDAALALKKKGHKITFYTSHHDTNHCFPETIDDTLEVVCVGDWLPRSTFGHLFAFWAYVRMIFVAFYLVYFSQLKYDVLFVDQVSACIPILRLKSNSRIIFYCHYPDQLLTERKTLLKKYYRKIIDYIEEVTTKMADVIFVNSLFTADVFRNTFKSIDVTPSVLYPSFDASKYQQNDDDGECYDTEEISFLSLNRYERKKNVELAILAFSKLYADSDPEIRKELKLIIAGGYDNRVKENLEYFSELSDLVHQLDLSESVQFLKSPSDDIKLSLLRRATCLIYTPANEHFGIVPIEAMCVGTPVIAVNNGGPTETVLDGETGFLREQNPEEFSKAMKIFLDKPNTKSSMSDQCKNRVRKHFSFDTFADCLHAAVENLLTK